MLARLTGPDGPKPVLRQGMFVQHAFQNAIEVVAPTLLTRRWRLLRYDRPCLLTGDEPLAVPLKPGTGVGNATVLWFPLDRRHALELSLRGSEGVVQAPLSKARKINALVASGSEKWLFHHPDDRPVDPAAVTPRMGLTEEVLDLVEDGLTVGEIRRVKRAPLI